MNAMKPIELGAPGAAVRLVQLLLKVISRLLPRGRIHLERPPQVLHIVHRLQLGNANSEHHHKESHQQVGVVVQRQHLLLKLLGNERIFRPLGDDAEKVVGEHKGDPFSVDAQLLLEVPQKVTKVNVEDLPVLVDHDVVWVAVADAQHEGGHAVAGTGACKVVHCVVVRIRVVLLDPLVQFGVVHLKCRHSSAHPLNAHHRLCVLHHLNQADVLAGGDAALVRLHGGGVADAFNLIEGGHLRQGDLQRRGRQAAQVHLQHHRPPIGAADVVQLRLERPEEVVAEAATEEGATEQKAGKGVVQVRFILQQLHHLNETALQEAVGEAAVQGAHGKLPNDAVQVAGVQQENGNVHRDHGPLLQRRVHLRDLWEINNSCEKGSSWVAAFSSIGMTAFHFRSAVR
ncbi:hypothetical protein TYRP_020060 [Tyrophagus putrescentiae]|nr:hypothetical protein TYRP_020060 [Tyrophagus putrescentiae]